MSVNVFRNLFHLQETRQHDLKKLVSLKQVFTVSADHE